MTGLKTARKCFAALFLVCACFPGHAGVRSGVLTPLVEGVDAYVMCIKSMKKQGGETNILIGTGVQIAPGVMATVAHQVEGVDSITVFSLDGAFSTGEVIALDRQNDLALVRIAKRPRGLTLVDIAQVDIGEEVFSIGCPFDLEHSVSRGYIKKPNVRFDDRSYIEMEMSVHSGDSGAPVFDLQGRWIGLVGGYLKQARNIGFAIPIQQLIALITRSRTHSDATQTIEIESAIQALWHQASTARGEAREKIYQRIVKQVARDDNDLYLQGISHYVLGHLSQASVFIGKYVRAAPSDHIAHVLLAEIQIKQQQYEPALDNLLKAKALQPKYATTYLFLGEVYDIGFSDVLAAKDNFQMFLKLSPSSTESYRIKRWLAKH